MDNQVPLNIIINTIAAIVTGIGINWLYDYLRHHEILPEVRSGARIGVRFLLFLLCIVPFAYLSIYPLTDVLSTETSNIVISQPSVAINGNVENSPVIVGPQGDVTIQQTQPTLTPSVRYSLSVSGYTQTPVCVSVGSSINVNANGGIILGRFIGSTNPDGKDSGAFDMSLDSYDLVPELAHGALLCRLDFDAKWSQCGTVAKLQATKNGCLEFEINDNDQGNNIGAFSVDIEVFSAP